MTFAEFCDECLDAPLSKYQKRMCDTIEKKYRKDGNFDSCVSTVRGGGPRSTICTQLMLLFYFYLKHEEINI